jgi:hypothetical protein
MRLPTGGKSRLCSSESMHPIPPSPHPSPHRDHRHAELVTVAASVAALRTEVVVVSQISLEQEDGDKLRQGGNGGSRLQRGSRRCLGSLDLVSELGRATSLYDGCRGRLKGRESRESTCGRRGGLEDRYGLRENGPCENPIIPIRLFYACRRRVRYYPGDSRS